MYQSGQLTLRLPHLNSRPQVTNSVIYLYKADQQRLEEQEQGGMSEEQSLRLQRFPCSASSPANVSHNKLTFVSYIDIYKIQNTEHTGT